MHQAAGSLQGRIRIENHEKNYLGILQYFRTMTLAKLEASAAAKPIHPTVLLTIRSHDRTMTMVPIHHTAQMI